MAEQDYLQDRHYDMKRTPGDGESPFVSICIPARNSEGCIGYTIENLLNQHYPRNRFEIVVGNNASTDKTVEIVNSYRSQHDIKLISVSESSQSRAHGRNRCLEVARGEVVIFIDSDVLVCDTFIEEHVRAHQLQSAGLVAGYVYGKLHVFGKDDDEGKRLKTSSITDQHEVLALKPKYKDSREFYECIDNNLDCQIITGKPDAWRAFWSCNMSARRKDLHDLGGFDESFTGWGLEDEELGYRFLQSGRELVFTKKAWGYHVPHAANERKNYAGFKRNLNCFFGRHKTADIELLHINFFPSTVKKILGASCIFFPNDREYAEIINGASAKLAQPAGSRLGLFVRQETDAAKLGLSHCFIPVLPWNTAPYEKELDGKHRRFYSLHGVRTGFTENEMDETVLPVDVLMFINESILSDILLETARVSKKIILLQGGVANNPDNAETRKIFERLFSLIRTNEVVRLDV